MPKRMTTLLIVVAVCGWGPHALAQEAERHAPPPVAEESAAGADEPGLVLPQADWLRISLAGMFAYTFDPAQASLGFERQARPGYIIVRLTGRLAERLRYVAAINPVSENEPLPTCGEEHFFFPNTPQNFGPNVACHNDGRVRVDDYRFIALDPLIQSGPIREAYLDYSHGPFRLRGGRFILPIGLGWEEAGSLTAKDAPHIQRINSEANSGAQVAFVRRSNGREIAEVSAAGVLGDGNQFRDYAYFYFINGSLDSNAWLTMLLAGRVSPMPALELRGALKRGHTGSKVERLPNFFASKRYDNATVVSATYSPVPHVRLLGELARYTWGPVESSAELLGLPYSGPVQKNGYWVGVDASHPIRNNLVVGTVLTREELSRDDSLTQHLAHQQLYEVSMGKKERSTTVRVYADIARMTRVGFFYNAHSNPFPWISGIAAVSGERQFQSREGGKWGLVVRFASR